MVRSAEGLSDPSAARNGDIAIGMVFSQGISKRNRTVAALRLQNLGKIAEVSVWMGLPREPVGRGSVPGGWRLSWKICPTGERQPPLHFEAQKASPARCRRDLFSAARRLATIASTTSVLAAIVGRAQANAIVIVMVAARSDGRLLSKSRTIQTRDGNNGENYIAKKLGHFDFPFV